MPGPVTRPSGVFWSGWPIAGTTAAIGANLRGLWEPYVAIPNRWDPRAFVSAIAPLLRSVGDNSEMRINLIAALPTRALRKHRKVAITIVKLKFGRRARLRCSLGEPSVDAFLLTTCGEIAELVERETRAAITAINACHFALVTGGIDDLYYLPIRISKLIGWAGFAVHSRLTSGQDMKPLARV